MVVLVKIFGIVIVILGAVFTINPNIIKQCVAFWQKGKNIYIGGVLNLLIGVIFLLAATQCKLAWVVTLMGIMGILKGVTVFALGLKGLSPLIKWWQERPLSILRLFAIIILGLGILLIYSA